MFECPKCKQPTRVLVYGKDDRACPSCNDPGERGYALRHSIAVRGSQGINLTHAETMRIKTNKLRGDGTYKPDARWRSRGTDYGD